MKKRNYCKTEIDKSAKVCPNCKRNQFTKASIISMVFVFIALFIIIFIVINSLSDNKPEEIVYNINDKITLSKTELVVTSVETSSKMLDDFWKCEDGEEFMLIGVSFKNTGSSDHTYSNSDFDLVLGENGLVKNPTLITGNDELSNQAIVSRGSIDTKLRFCVAKDIEPITLRYEYDFWSTKVEIKIR